MKKTLLPEIFSISIQPLNRKDASSLNATSLPLKAGVRQNLSCSDYVSTLFQVVVASSYFFSSIYGPFSMCSFYALRCATKIDSH